MFSRVFSGAVHGIEGFVVNVEADVSDGLPIFNMVGFLASEVKEARERVRISIRNSGFRFTSKRITINLSPADIRKAGTAFDLPIAVSILAASGYIPQKSINEVIILGELSLNGDICPVTGVLPIVYEAQRQGFRKCMIPYENRKEGAVIQGMEVYGIRTLKEITACLNHERSLKPEPFDISQMFQKQTGTLETDFSEIKGQTMAKRAIEVAVSGMHNILLIGPPGTGKTMLVKRIPEIMPEFTLEESLEISKIYSVSGLLNPELGLIMKRPFRAPHHTVTGSALVGGGRIPKPGEVSLAYHGVLFLDELLEFNKYTLELLRQPLEDRKIMISRVDGAYEYPADFMLAAAMNPCSCGYYPDREKCNCSLNQVKKYLGRVSQPFLDRIDICTETNRVGLQELEAPKIQEGSEQIRERVARARDIQRERYKKESFCFNGRMQPKNLEKYCFLEKEEKRLLREAFEHLNLSARAYHRIIKVARTIADLEGLEKINTDHISEAICYRSIDKKYWGE